MTATSTSGPRNLVLPVLLGLALSGTASAQAAAPPPPPSPAELKVMLDTVWVMVTAFLVFFMNAGFGCVESGLCRAKNATNILGKNFVVFAFSTIAYWLVGFALMFGDGNSFMGMSGWLVTGADNSPAMASAYQGVYRLAELDRCSAAGEVLLPARLCRYGGHHRFRLRS